MTETSKEPHWWMRPMTLESLADLRKTIKEAHGRGLGLAGVTMNQLEIALAELHDRMLKEVPR